MDDKGRFIIPDKFVGKTFEETGVAKEVKETAAKELAEGNRRERRRLEAIQRAQAKLRVK